ncbi:MAG: helical backbone metal receptor [bacterium]|nr:helical backbone metal receptor [bacterium]
MKVILGLLLLIFNLGYANNYPKRIISLSTTATEELYILGVEDRLVGCTIYCNRPKEAEKKEKVGTVMKVDLERVISLKPDLIIASGLSDPKQMEKLKSLGINISYFSAPISFSQLCDDFIRLGCLVGKEEKAKKMVNKAKKKVEKIRKKTGVLPKPKVFMQIGAKPLWTVPGNTLQDDFIQFSGGINIAREAKTGQYSLEEVFVQNPDVIIIIEMGTLGEEEKKNWQRFSILNAVKRNKIYYLDASNLCSPTPLNFPATLEEIAKILHK